MIRPHRIGVDPLLAKVFSIHNPRSGRITAATCAVRNSVRDPGQAGEGRREPALVGVEVPAGEVRDEQVGLSSGQDGGRVDQPVQVDPGINDPRENAERGERATAQPS